MHAGKLFRILALPQRRAFDRLVGVGMGPRLRGDDRKDLSFRDGHKVGIAAIERLGGTFLAPLL
jgi:hypothetical protein